MRSAGAHWLANYGNAMALDWPIPEVDTICNNGPEWLLSLLEPLTETARMVVLMTMWRAWYVRNEITYDKAPSPTEASRRFLHGYITSLLCIHQHPHGDLEKGKMVVHDSLLDIHTKEVPKPELHWTPPPPGWAKLNTDGSHVPPTGEAGGGMILRDDRGNIIYTACRQLLTCDNGLEAELAACREGLELALYRTNPPIMVELDCAEAMSMLLARTGDRSQYRVLIEEIRRLAQDARREISFTLISRSQNKVSHALAAYGRATPRTAVWLCSGLDFVVNLSKADMPP